MNSYSHDLMNSLYTIKGMAEVHLENEPDTSREVMSRMKAKAEEALLILKRLRGSSLQPNGKRVSSQGRSHRVSVRHAFEETKRLLDKQGLAEGIEFLDRIPQDFPPIECSRSQFREILYHLMKNACEAMKEKKSGERKLILRASVLEGGKAVLRLTDTGEGISPADLSRLFEPFFTTKPEGKGNGLGLYLVKKLTEENQGSISLESFPTEGTTATLIFPAASFEK
jgi:signal transduction histidine kinase